ncbi:hypothetical protein MA16_Dca017404 [Dendrobium catenatum]|uniref:Uncharacterized protein n=1 Tax=Dendrobium catenatum TaxID=906689 RepID=A0A2I0X0C0_9ASPA|nr:hypothetical protein MA16_Dca017404 [Dendrobium catenatum]
MEEWLLKYIQDALAAASDKPQTINMLEGLADLNTHCELPEGAHASNPAANLACLQVVIEETFMHLQKSHELKKSILYRSNDSSKTHPSPLVEKMNQLGEIV